MDKIYKAREHTQREKKGLEHPSKNSKLRMEEEMIGLYQTINSLLSHFPKKVIQFIGSRKGEGTSTIIHEFARVLAKFNKLVLIVDADGRKLNQHLFPGIKSKYRPACLLVSNKQISDTQKFSTIWEKLRQQFDFILVDSPPATSSHNGLSISPKVDGVVLVFEADKTRWPVAESVKVKIVQNGGRILGIVFNKRRYYIPEFIYKKL
jgi:protein-tyrosine kinase